MLKKLLKLKRDFICFAVMTEDRNGRPHGWKWLVMVTVPKNYHLFRIGYQRGNKYD